MSTTTSGDTTPQHHHGGVLTKHNTILVLMGALMGGGGAAGVPLLTRVFGGTEVQAKHFENLNENPIFVEWRAKVTEVQTDTVKVTTSFDKLDAEVRQAIRDQGQRLDLIAASLNRIEGALGTEKK